MMEYVGTISKLKEEVATLKALLTQKSKEEERLKGHVKKIEESQQQFTSHANVLFIASYRVIRLEVKKL
jgi:hypothetical protein